MTAQELLKIEIDEVGQQIERGLQGLSKEHADFRVAECAMSLRELLIHLCDVYQAVPAQLEGKEYEWGSFKPASDDWNALTETAKSMRAHAVSLVLSDEDVKLKAGADFIVAHDNYHLGQFVTTRLALQPEWNSYSIYG